jgi:mycoredoxin
VRPVRRILDQAGASYRYIDISQSEVDRERLIEINQGYASVPTLVFADDSVLTEPSAAEVQAKLIALGHKIRSPSRRSVRWAVLGRWALLLVGLGLVGLGLVRDGGAWIAVGIALALVGLLLSRR